MRKYPLTSLFFALALLLLSATVATAQDPGIFTPDTSLGNDQRQGAVLFYNVYASSASNPTAENTRINITNTNPFDGAYVHLFYIDGSNCSPADNFICLTPNQTTSFNMSDIDPGVTGFIIAVVTAQNGEPVPFNFLIGDEYVKFQSGHTANLGAIAIAGIADSGRPPVDGSIATLPFDNVFYNALPRVLANDHVMSRGDGNSTMFIINRIGGSLLTQVASIGSLFGILYDPLENPYSWTYSGGCQRKAILGVDFPKTAPPFNNIISAGSYGWMKFWSTGAADSDEPALLGAAINYNPNPASNMNSYNGGHNLHQLTYTESATLIIPVFPAGCE